MTFTPGSKKPEKSGRKAGTPNKKTQDLMEKCEKMGIDPFEGLLELSKCDDPSIKLAALKEVCSFLYPKRGARGADTTLTVVQPAGPPITEELLLRMIPIARGEGTK